MPNFAGVAIGVFDSNGTEVKCGDRIHGVRRSALPNCDGWGRDLPGEHKTSYQTQEYDGVVIFNNGTSKNNPTPNRAEFVIDCGYCHRDFYELDKFYVVK